MTIEEARDAARKMLVSSPVLAASAQTSYSLDISIILASTLGIGRSRILAHPELQLGDKESTFFQAVEQRAQGIPVAYITGIKEFWGLPFSVSPAVLIPKPDTEILVERAISILENIRMDNKPVRVLDVCTGSGCVAVSLKHAIPRIDMTATDISPEALGIAEKNARAILSPSFTPISFVEGDLRKGLPHADGGYDLVVSNPPYVPTMTARQLLTDGRNEPILALDGGADGLDLVRALVDNVRIGLATGGVLLVETGEYNAREAAAYMSERGFAGVTIHKDLADQDRVVEGTLQ